MLLEKGLNFRQFSEKLANLIKKKSPILIKLNMMNSSATEYHFNCKEIKKKL